MGCKVHILCVVAWYLVKGIGCLFGFCTLVVALLVWYDSLGTGHLIYLNPVHAKG